MQERFRQLLRGDSGQDLAEYGILVALIAIVAVLGVTAFGGQISTWFTTLGAAMPLP